MWKPADNFVVEQVVHMSIDINVLSLKKYTFAQPYQELSCMSLPVHPDNYGPVVNISPAA